MKNNVFSSRRKPPSRKTLTPILETNVNMEQVSNRQDKTNNADYTHLHCLYEGNKQTYEHLNGGYIADRALPSAPRITRAEENHYEEQLYDVIHNC